MNSSHFRSTVCWYQINKNSVASGLHMDNLFQIKLGTLFIIWLVGFAGGILPQFKRESAKLLGFGNCFSGGVFLAAALVHLLPEAVEGFQRLDPSYERHAYVFCLVGIFLPFLVERVLIKNHNHEFLILPGDATTKSILSVYLLMILLSVHSTIEGIALGVQSNPRGTWAVMWAIVAHKFFAAFALGVSLVKGGVSTKWLLQIVFFFSLTTPVGGCFGMLLNLSFDSGLAGFLSESFKGIAAGTFIYVSLMEVIADEFRNHSHREHRQEVEFTQQEKWKKFSFLSIGLFLMTLVSMYGFHESYDTRFFAEDLAKPVY